MNTVLINKYFNPSYNYF